MMYFADVWHVKYAHRELWTRVCYGKVESDGMLDMYIANLYHDNQKQQQKKNVIQKEWDLYNVGIR